MPHVWFDDWPERGARMKVSLSDEEIDRVVRLQPGDSMVVALDREEVEIVWPAGYSACIEWSGDLVLRKDAG